MMGWERSWPARWFEASRRRLNRWLVSRLIERTSPPAGSRILEAGSGSGYGSSVFARHPAVGMSVALDCDPNALRAARRRDPGLAVVLGDLHQLPFRHEAFDVVWNNSTLEHVARPGEALREMRRVTRAGGCVFVGVPYRFGPLGFQPCIARTRFGVWIGPVFDRCSLSRLVQAQGLRPVAMMRYYLACFIGVFARKPSP